MPVGEELDTNFTLLEGVERNVIIQTLKAAEGNKLEARQTPRHWPPDALQQNQGFTALKSEFAALLTHIQVKILIQDVGEK